MKEDPEMIQQMRMLIAEQFGFDPSKLTHEQWFEIDSYIPQF
jgi:hypothetical protein